MFFQIAGETILLLIINVHEKLCSHVRKSHLEIKKLRNLENKKLRKLRNLHCVSFFSVCTIFRKYCTALSQSELRIFSCILLIVQCL
jgi:hypothetical protein